MSPNNKTTLAKCKGCFGEVLNFILRRFLKPFVFFSWNNGLREAVVTDTFLFLSTFFIQVLRIS